MKHTLTLFTALLLVIYQGGNHAIAGIWDKGTSGGAWLRHGWCMASPRLMFGEERLAAGCLK